MRLQDSVLACHVGLCGPDMAPTRLMACLRRFPLLVPPVDKARAFFVPPPSCSASSDWAQPFGCPPAHRHSLWLPVLFFLSQ